MDTTMRRPHRMIHVELDLPVVVHDEFYAVQKDRLAENLPVQGLKAYLEDILSQATSDSHERRTRRLIRSHWHTGAVKG